MRSVRGLPLLLIGIGLAVLAVAVVSLTAAGRASPSAAPAVEQIPPAGGGGDPIAADIDRQQAELRQTPDNYAAWASLGLDYVQQAKVTSNPAYYPKAEGVLQRSLQLNDTENVTAFAGEAALKAAEHDFVAARDWASRGLRFDPYNATLYGALNDADTQLGRYEEASAAAAKLNALQPGVPAFTRAEYVYELRGDLSNAKRAMQRALEDATAPADQAFAHYYLGELAFNAGDPAGALGQAQAGQAVDPSYSALLELKAKAEAALGQPDAAAGDYAAVVSAVPQPQYVLEAGEFLQSVGREQQAQQQYRLFDAETELFRANGVQLDTDPTLFYADHGDPRRALSYGETGIRIRPFVEMDDAYAWALHVNHRDVEAVSWEAKAMQLGTRNALFFFHRGVIEQSLGQRDAAVRDLRQALAINPYFSPFHAPAARAALAQLGGSV